MDAAGLTAYLRDNFTDHPEPKGRTLFRLETLDSYEVAADGSDFGRYLDGGEAPTAERKKPWETRLQTEFDRGLRRSRVHVVETQPGELLPPYIEYECAWSYTRNSQWEDIRILDLAEVDLAPEERDLFVVTGDFWLVNGEDVVRMDYDNQSRFVGAEVVEDGGAYRQATAVAWQSAEPFAAWWARQQQKLRRAG